MSIYAGFNKGDKLSFRVEETSEVGGNSTFANVRVSVEYMEGYVADDDEGGVTNVTEAAVGGNVSDPSDDDQILSGSFEVSADYVSTYVDLTADGGDVPGGGGGGE
jgi:hypothetical protein